VGFSPSIIRGVSRGRRGWEPGFDLAERIRDNSRSGPVAQLGARFHGMEEVIGSIPIRSTNYLHHFSHKR
jgi:hypothetical protein